ncbi:MAG TPA: hypothetical protein VKY19_22150 [Ktedonosporobacter sp.]|nr:hypothetical protein [Ktedonosporobacter sp.]
MPIAKADDILLLRGRRDQSGSYNGRDQSGPYDGLTSGSGSPDFLSEACQGTCGFSRRLAPPVRGVSQLDQTEPERETRRASERGVSR